MSWSSSTLGVLPNVTACIPTLGSYLQAGCPSCRPPNNVEAKKAKVHHTPLRERRRVLISLS